MAGKGFCPAFARQAALQHAVNEGHDTKWFLKPLARLCLDRGHSCLRRRQVLDWAVPRARLQLCCQPLSALMLRDTAYLGYDNGRKPLQNWWGISHSRVASHVMWGRMRWFSLPVGDRRLGSGPGQQCRFENPNLRLTQPPRWLCVLHSCVFCPMHEARLLLKKCYQMIIFELEST